ncbi:hypothetical protein F4808DRAFT_453246 [Astrocystis sublimbata]|nr:hypothetical protein F4808DRAFT_453246 [Astrocystis sublimbata]
MRLILKGHTANQGPHDISPIDKFVQGFRGRLSQHRRLTNGQLIQELDLTAYESYFQQQWCAIAADAGGCHVAAQKVEDILSIVGSLIKGHDRPSIVARLKQKYPTATESACQSSVDLTVRLLLMLKVGVVRHQANPSRCLNWENGSLRDFVHERFNKPPVLDCHNVRLPKSFDAWGLNIIGGLELEFTDNLADHLLLVEDDTTVMIFHHASFLERQENTLYPNGLVDETLQTLALLFPQSEFGPSIRRDTAKRAWFKKLCLTSSPYAVVDSRVAMCGNLGAEKRQIERFTFWRDRLIILKQVYDDAAPRTLRQWWFDRRNGERWFTFWVAVLVLLITITLGLVQCVEGALQVYKAYYPTAN